MNNCLTDATDISVGNTAAEMVINLKPEGKFEIYFAEQQNSVGKGQIDFQNEFYRRYLKDPEESLIFLGFSHEKVPMSESLYFIQSIASRFIKKLTKEPYIELLREKAKVTLESEDIHELIKKAPYMSGMENLDEDWLRPIWARLNMIFSKTIKYYDGSVSDFFLSYNSNINLAGRVYFHLVESKNEDFPFAFMATYSMEGAVGNTTKHLPLKNALLDYGKNSRKMLTLLSTVNRAAQKSPFTAGLLQSGEIFYPINLTSDEAYTFLHEVPLYEESGILCRIPNWWKYRSNKAGISINIGDKTPSHLGYEAILDFKAEITMGGEEISAEELKKLLAETEGLAFIKGKWIEVNHEKLKEVLKAYEQAQKLMGDGDFNIIEAMRFQLTGEKMLRIDDEDFEFEITNGEWLKKVLNHLIMPDTIKAIDCNDNFRAVLRPYQQTGLNWLNFMKELRLGACLADDMGLGKTVQTLALLNYLKRQSNLKTLLIIPASLIGNWKTEIDRFAPNLNYLILHPSETKVLDKDEIINFDDTDVFITTYGMVLKIDWLKDMLWDIIILDEAQAIKNPATKQTKKVKALKSNFRIVMTGTPIENRLSDLWSIFDFLNRGLLGSSKEFGDFTKKLKEKHQGYNRLKQVVSPFILRRLKTDKKVISDLPDKIEMKTYSSLSKKQTVLYSSLIKELGEKLESVDEGISKKGLVLSALMKFKQICNHPDQYLGQNCYAEEESGKYERLREICETIYEKRERVLIFTQFKEITEPLRTFLESIFHHKGLVLHGSTSVKKRKEIVDKFQGEEYVPFMVLSIKAGGVGLNLTSANHVIHFDRWWNPAVENQATDRAFRIGQRKNVIVHKFITKGTIEEKIDLMIEDKIKLSQDIISDAKENWITELNNKQLMELFKLSV